MPSSNCTFLRTIDKAVPAELDVDCIVDTYASPRHPKVEAWLAARPRWHMHCVPTYSSWLNQVERFFAIITDKGIRGGSFASVKQLTKKTLHSPFGAWRPICEVIAARLQDPLREGRVSFIQSRQPRFHGQCVRRWKLRNLI